MYLSGEIEVRMISSESISVYKKESLHISPISKLFTGKSSNKLELKI